MFIVPLGRSSVDMARNVDRLFNNGAAVRSPALDLAETDAGYSVTLDLPGVAKDDVKVSIEGRSVSVEAQAQRNGEKKDGDRIVYRERAGASFARSFKLPVELNEAESNAKLENGVLTLTLAKRHPAGARKITVN